jgi:hypothetical protein
MALGTALENRLGTQWAKASATRSVKESAMASDSLSATALAMELGNKSATQSETALARGLGNKSGIQLALPSFSNKSYSR